MYFCCKVVLKGPHLNSVNKHSLVCLCACGHKSAANNLAEKFKAVLESDFELYFKEMQSMPGQSCVVIIHQWNRKGSKLFFFLYFSFFLWDTQQYCQVLQPAHQHEKLIQSCNRL